MTARVLITGVNGFSGRHMAACLLSEPNTIVLGTGRRSQAIAAVDDYRSGELTDRDSVAAMLAWAQPDTVIHLAGLLGEASDEELRRVNVLGFENLCDALALQAAHRRIRLLAVGSAAELGSAGAAQLPVTEETQCEPDTPYGRSKHAMIIRAMATPVGGALEVIAVRPFNLVGPGLDSRLALGNFARQLTAARRGEIDTIHCGPLSARRDYLDVRDAVEAYLAAIRLGTPGQLYNVCSGRSFCIDDLLTRMIDISGARVRVLESRPNGAAGPLDIFGDAGKLSRLTGWRPVIPLETSLRQLIESAAEELPPGRSYSRPLSALSQETGQLGSQLNVPLGRE